MTENSTIFELFTIIDQHLGTQRHDIALYGLSTFLGLTNSEESVQQLLDIPKALAISIELLHHPKLDKKASDLLASCLINISSYEKAAQQLLNIDLNKFRPILSIDTSNCDNIVDTCCFYLRKPDHYNAEGCSMILGNLSRPPYLVEKIVDIMEKNGDISVLIETFVSIGVEDGGKLSYVGSILENLSRSSRVRKVLLDEDKKYIQRLLPFIEYKESLIRRQRVIGILKNCCFEVESHEWLLSEKVDILPRLLLPLAGGEQFDDEDNEKLPLDLQYLPEDKEREDDPEIRCNLIEAITQLCTKRKNREYIRDKNTYIILRELHKREKIKKVTLACENLVDLLIRTEDEIGLDNLNEVEVSDELKEQFQKADEDFLKEEK